MLKVTEFVNICPKARTQSTLKLYYLIIIVNWISKSWSTNKTYEQKNIENKLISRNISEIRLQTKL